MYGKLFVSIYDGTLAEDWRALITFQQMIILCDSDGILDMTPSALQKRTGIPIEHIKAGIEILEAEDPYSRTTKENGKRIIRLDPDRPWGWSIVNHKHYKDLRTAEDRREYMRKYMKEKREKEKLTKTNKSLQKLHVSKLADTNTYSYTDTNKDIKPSCPENKFSDEDYYTAEYIHKKITEIVPGTKTPNFHKWANTIRLMRERDSLTQDEIKQVFDWANNDPFWNTNVLSPDKLRKQFPKLRAKMKVISQNASQSTTESHNEKALNDWINNSGGNTYDAE